MIPMSDYEISDGDTENEGVLLSGRFDPATSSAAAKEDKEESLQEVKRKIYQCLSGLETSADTENRRELEDRLAELQVQKKNLQDEISQQSEQTYELRPRKKSTHRIFPVVVQGQNLEYRPRQNTDMSDVMEKLPTLQDGAYPWTSKMDELMVGTQFAMGGIKKLLANLIGIPAMGEILQRAGLNRYVGTAVNDVELFSANRARIWRALRDTFPTNVHPDNVIIEPLGQEENLRAYVLRAFQKWRNVTGNDPDLNQMEQSIL